LCSEHVAARAYGWARTGEASVVCRDGVDLGTVAGDVADDVAIRGGDDADAPLDEQAPGLGSSVLTRHHATALNRLQWHWVIRQSRRAPSGSETK
jgi:hypothetical protein